MVSLAKDITYIPIPKHNPMQDKREVFRKYPNPIFLETGSYNGDGIAYALKCGFERVISIEIDEAWYAKCLNKYAGNNKVELYHGDSQLLLTGILTTVNRPCTFWLDAHVINKKQLPKLNNPVPLIQELNVIEEHVHHKNLKHTILIDDIRNFDREKGWNNITLEDIVSKLYEINPDYTIEYVFGVQENDILTAKP